MGEIHRFDAAPPWLWLGRKGRGALGCFSQEAVGRGQEGVAEGGPESGRQHKRQCREEQVIRLHLVAALVSSEWSDDVFASCWTATVVFNVHHTTPCHFT